MKATRIHFEEPSAGLQRLTARFGGHAYDLHRHETYAVGLTVWGAQSFHYRGRLRTSRCGQVMVIHPDEAHDGHANNDRGADQGFAYRMLYVDPASVSAALDGANPPFVPRRGRRRSALADLLGEAFADFPQALEPLALDAIIGRLAELLAGRGVAPNRSPARTPRRAVTRAREFLAAEVASHRLVGGAREDQRPRPLRARRPTSAPLSAPARAIPDRGRRIFVAGEREAVRGR